MSSIPTCTICLVNETDFPLTYVETSPKDPQKRTIPAKGRTDPTDPKAPITVDDPTPGSIEIVACDGYIDNYSYQVEPEEKNWAEYTIRDDRLVKPPNIENRPGPEYTAKIINDMNKEIYYFIVSEGKIDKGNVPPHGHKTEIRSAVSFIKTVFSMREYGSALAFPWNGTTTIRKTVTARENSGQVELSVTDGC